jgi:hypothetical protein
VVSYNLAIMKLLILAVLLAVSQAATPVPRQAADITARSSQDVKQNPNAKQSPATAPSPIPNATSPKDNEHTGKTPAKADTPESVFIAETAAMPIHKDWWDKAYVVFTGLLVIVGGLGVFFAIKTLRGIERQAHEMRRQRHEMRRQRLVLLRQWRAMGGQSKLMAGQLREMEKSREIDTKTLILQYRPKIIVRDATASDFNVAELGKPAQGKVRFIMVNTGGSAAHIDGGWVAVWSAESPSSSPIEIKQGKEERIGAFTLQPGEETPLERVLNTGVTNSIQWANFHQAIKTEPSRYIYLVGVINYRDDLGILRRTGINRTYDPKTKTFVPGTLEGEYED